MNQSRKHEEYIEFKNINFRFIQQPDHPWILREFNLTIRKGEFQLLLGPSGCGKTTVLNLLAGFEIPQEGKVLIGGELIQGPGADRIVIFQGDDSLYPWLTAFENVEFGLKIANVPTKERQKVASEYIRLVGLEGQEKKYPSQLSGGMKQRIQIARALARHSPVILMDEPFAAVDAQTREILQQELSLIWERTGCTILFITHDITEAIILADSISVMKAGPESAVIETILNTLSRPRSLSDPGFGKIYQRIHTILGEEVQKFLNRGLK